MDPKTRQEKKSRHYKEPYNQKSLRIQEAMREKEKEKEKVKTNNTTMKVKKITY
jgi:hypothetical protein